ADGAVGEVNATLGAGGWSAAWAVPADLPPGEYRFSVGGVDKYGNTIGPVRTAPAPAVTGTLERSFQGVPRLLNRTETLRVTLPASEGDVEPRFVLEGPEGQTAEPEVSVQDGRYRLVWRTGLAESLGAWRVRMDARDALGNNVTAVSGDVSLRPATLGIRLLQGPREVELEKTAVFEFAVVYADGSIAPPSSLTVRVGIGRGNLAVEPEPRLAIVGDRFVATWTPPANVEPSTYRIVIAGRDADGNEIQTYLGQGFAVRPSLLRGLIGVPALELLGALLAVGAAAVAGRALRFSRRGP
ncbi:MAG TPA: hypothetical protein VM681_00485, partial [Candidatus Thermoplasmatota archaeon]|nr:hypothetical protein [Candidatus Thermoplasmatota archaeon]